MTAPKPNVGRIWLYVAIYFFQTSFHFLRRSSSPGFDPLARESHSLLESNAV